MGTITIGMLAFGLGVAVGLGCFWCYDYGQWKGWW